MRRSMLAADRLRSPRPAGQRFRAAVPPLLCGRPRELTLELADGGPVSSLGLGKFGSELRLPLLEAFDGGLALVGVALGHGTVEDEATHPTLVGRSLTRRSDARPRGTGPRRARRRLGAGAGIAEVDADRVVAKVGADPGRRGLEARERAQPGQLTLGVDEERVVVGDDPALGRDLLEHRSRSSAPTARGRASTSSGSAA